ncbi:MAG: ABC transporter ATP-binding protein [Acutalibacteraceae bacterium]|nr:ABC transporter ATP-binding protein [Acutalibacteraceae bacterium]
MKKLLKYLKAYQLQSILAPLFKMTEALFELFIPLLVARVIDIGIANNDIPLIIKICILLGCLALMGLICSVTAQYFSAKAAIGFTSKIRHVLYSHIQSLSYTELDSIGTSTLITRLTSDMNQVQNGVNLTLRLFLRSPFIVFGAMIMAFTIDKKAALLFLGTICLLSVIIFGIILGCIPLYNKIQSSLDELLSITRENLSGIRVIRAFCNENEETHEFKNSNKNLTDLQNFTGKISALMNPLTFIVVNIAIIILIYTGAIEVNKGTLTQGAVVALYNYMSQILVELIKLANLIITITKSVACGNRIQAVLEIESSIINPENSIVCEDSEYIIEVKNASLRYKNSPQCALENISFKVRKGETVGIIGGTGSGKTSIVNMIAGFYTAQSGKVLYKNKNISDYPLKQLRDSFGIVPQKAVLFKGTLRDNIKWGCPDANDTDIVKALDTAQAKEIFEQKQGGLDFMIEQGGKNLSGGQRQRLTIARAVIKQPEILILDDSSSALDYITDSKLRKAIRNIDPSPTVFLVSQRTSSVMYADKILVIDDGRIVGQGQHDDLLKSCDIYKEIYDSQFSKG